MWKCAGLGDSKAIIRAVQKFYIKHAAARLLAALLFDPHKTLVEEMKQNVVFERQKFVLDSLLGLDAVTLQNYVRTQFMSIPPSRWIRPFKDFVSGVVTVERDGR